MAYRTKVISIHASAREATGRPGHRRRLSEISIHASAREATRKEWMCRQILYISIHASAREATIGKAILTLQMFYFNPRLREGGDGATNVIGDDFPDFNPRLREGGDRIDY